MKKNRIFTIVAVLVFVLGLLSVSMVAAGNSEQGEAGEYLALVGEETGLVAAYEDTGNDCVYDNGYSVYLCQEVPTNVMTQPDLSARAQALEMLGGSGLLLIPESSNDRVMAFDPTTGNLVDPNFIPTDTVNLSTPINAILGPDGSTVLVSDQLDDAVQAYDISTGAFITTFAGNDTSVLDNIRGISLDANGNLLATVGSGTNADGIPQFDTSGTYVGNFIANGAGGLDSPFDVTGHPAIDWLVGGISSNAIHNYDTSGTYVGDLSAIDSFPEQINMSANGNILVANFSGTETGIVEYTITGTQVAIYTAAGVSGYRGVYELPNNNLLVTTGGGVFEIDRNGNLVDTKISGVSSRFIEYVSLGAPTIGLDSLFDSSTQLPNTQISHTLTISNLGDADLQWSIDELDGATVNGPDYTLDTPWGEMAQSGSAVSSDGCGLDIPWLSLSPITGTVVPSGTQDVTLSYDSTGLAAGSVHTGTLCINSNDANNPTIFYPVALEVALDASTDFSKTVGLDTSCASSNSVTIPAGGGGTNVVYCYLVTNTGNITMPLHTLVDSELGTMFSDLPFALGPGSGAYLTTTILITETTVNTATWTSFMDGLLPDPGNDTIGTGSPQLDLLGLSAMSDGNDMVFTLTFSGTISPADSPNPDALIGLVDINVDRNGMTGFFGGYDFFCQGGNVGGLGLGPYEYLLDLSSYTSGSGALFLIDLTTGMSTPVPATYTSNSVTIEVPMSALGNDDGYMEVATVIGTVAEPTDCAGIVTSGLSVEDTETATVTRGAPTDVSLSGFGGQEKTAVAPFIVALVSTLFLSLAFLAWRRQRVTE